MADKPQNPRILRQTVTRNQRFGVSSTFDDVAEAAFFLAGAYSFPAEPGSFALAGQDVTVPTYRLFAETGTFSYSGRSFGQAIEPGPTIKLVTLGDSITEHANGFVFGDITALYNRTPGEIHWVKARGKAGFRFDVWSDAAARWIHNGTAWASAPLFNGANQGRAGDWATGVRRRLSAVINMAPDIVVLNVGTNNGLDNNNLASVVISELGTIVSELTNGTGIRLIVGTIRPRMHSASGSSGTFAIEQAAVWRTRIETINAYIRTLDNNSTIFVWDPEPDLLDPAPTEPMIAGSAYRWVTYDGVHLTPRGAYASSKSLSATIDRILGDGTWFDDDAETDNAITNGVLAGTGGTVGTGVTGEAPDNHTVDRSSSAVAITAASSVDADGWLLNLTSPGGLAVSNNFTSVRLKSPDITVSGTDWTSSTWVKVFAEVEVSANEIIANTTLNYYHASTLRAAGLSFAIANRASRPYPSEAHSGWIETPPQQIGAATTVRAQLDVEVRTDVAGSATVRLKRWIVREVEDPRVTFPYDPMNPQVYALAGPDVALSRTGSSGLSNLIADVGVFAVTAPTTNLGPSRRMVADNGRFVALGQGKTVLVDEQGAYLLDEQGAVLVEDDSNQGVSFSVAFTVTRQIVADPGTFTQAGQEASFVVQVPGVYVFAAEAGTFVQTGQDIAPVLSLILPLDEGAFLSAGQDADLFHSRQPLEANVGLFSTLGQSIEIRRDLSAEPLLLVVSGSVDFRVSLRRVLFRFGPILRAPGKLYPGSTARITGTFNDEDDVPFDPHEVKLVLISPSLREQSWTYGEGEEIRKVDYGRYVIEVELDEPGRWIYRWELVARDVTSVKEGSLLVQGTPSYAYNRRRYA